MIDLMTFNITSDGFNILICMIALLTIFLWQPTLGRQFIYIACIMFCDSFQIAFNLLGLVFKGSMASYAHGLLIFTNFMEFFCGYMLSYAITCYIISFIEKHDDMHFYKRVALGITLFATMMLVISQFTGLYYTIDDLNFYHRSAGYPLSLIFPIIALIFVIFITLHYHSRLDAMEKIAIGVYIILPFVALVTQPLIYGLYTMQTIDTIAVVIMCLIIQMSQTQKSIRNMEDMQQMQISLMLSQIQPHFLYNCLNTIGYLCEKDPPLAKQSLDDFSNYLRGNLDSLKLTRPVPLEKELEHVRVYLSLEKMRFDDSLNIVYDIETTAFLIPSLTIQPLVENAVKYGLGKKVGGGTVTIHIFEDDQSFIITIEDDGVGYDPYQGADGKRSHIGIMNVRSRLDAMVNGTLEIESEKGKGTKATIKIPKEVVTYEDHRIR